MRKLKLDDKGKGKEIVDEEMIQEESEWQNVDENAHFLGLSEMSEIANKWEWISEVTDGLGQGVWGIWYNVI